MKRLRSRRLKTSASTSKRSKERTRVRCARLLKMTTRLKIKPMKKVMVTRRAGRKRRRNSCIRMKTMITTSRSAMRISRRPT